MEHKEVLELTKRFKKDNATFTRICGCYVDCNKNKIVTYGSKFLTLDDEEFYKYLEIAKKSLSGKIGNNLLELSFPEDEERIGNRQHMLMALRDCDLEDKNLVDRYFDHIIDTYDNTGNYLILLYADTYDVVKKTNDNMKIDESEEVYKYIICSICPVTLSKPGLGYREEDNSIGARDRDWVVGMPESAFLFPAFTDRSSDIHSVLVYTKDVKEPHEEFMTDTLGCKAIHTSTQKQLAFTNMVVNANDDVESNVSLDVNIELSQKIEEHMNNNEDVPVVDKSFIVDTLKDSNIPAHKAEKIAANYVEAFDEEVVVASELVDSKVLKSSEVLIANKELSEENKALKEQLSSDSDKKLSVTEIAEIYTEKYDVKNSNVNDFIDWLKSYV